ncbi:GAF domain-containing protein [Gracilimonas sp.]|uniref:GAF domain-containing protein n=1 Tax=Gracilimonas TaxID=649462 RepID=UPI0025BF76F0|nr:GAF domain-containing protein [Gracilimonas sp.]
MVDGINRTLQLKEVLRKCMEAAKVVMNSEASSLMLLDELTGDLNVSIPTGPVKDEIMGMAVPKSKGIGGWVISYNQPFISNDVVESDIFWKDLSTGFTTRNIICVPLQDNEGQAFGVLQAINKKDGQMFVNEDVPVFESLALHVASAIERSKKFDEVERKLAEREEEILDIHTRLNDNLSAISDLLEFDLEEIRDLDSRKILKATNTRIKSMMNVQPLLSEKSESGTINLSKYLGLIAGQVEQSFEDSDVDVRFTLRFEDAQLDGRRSMLCGLILNELMTAAYKKASSSKEIGEVIVSLKQTGKEKVVVIVTDNGRGTEDIQKDVEGMKSPKAIIRNLAEKLEADLTYTQNPEIGSTSILSFHI